MPKTVLVTGASGLLGQALIERLRELHELPVIALVHRVQLDGDVETVSGDICEPRFGLDPAEFAALARRVDAVVHAAAGTEYTRGVDEIVTANERGTAHALELAAAADAYMVHVSTAYTKETAEPRPDTTVLARGGEAYRVSKHRAEELVANSDVPATIVRPSVIIGDSRTGKIAKFQAAYALFGLLLEGKVPFIPLLPDSGIDLVPQDVVADAIAALLEHEPAGEVAWLTAGQQALTLRSVVSEIIKFASTLDIGLDEPRFVDPTIVDRLIRPVFMDEFPRRVANQLERIFVLNTVMTSEHPYPTSLPQLADRWGVRELPDPLESLRRSLQFWVDRTGVVTRARG